MKYFLDTVGWEHFDAIHLMWLVKKIFKKA